MYKGTVFKGETAPRLTFLCSDLQCLPPCDPISLRLLKDHSIVRCSINADLGPIYMNDMCIPTTSVAGEIQTPW